MLVLSRKVGESIVIDDLTTVRVLSCKGHTIRLAIEAPRDVHIAREELLKKNPNQARSHESRLRQEKALALN